MHRKQVLVLSPRARKEHLLVSRRRGGGIPIARVSLMQCNTASVCCVFDYKGCIRLSVVNVKREYCALYVNTGQTGRAFKGGELCSTAFLAKHEGGVVAVYSCASTVDKHERRLMADLMMDSGKVLDVDEAHRAMEVDHAQWPCKRVWCLAFVGPTVDRTPASPVQEWKHTTCSPRGDEARFKHFTQMHAVPLKSAVPLLKEDGTTRRAAQGSASGQTFVPSACIPWEVLTPLQRSVVLKHQA